MLPLDNHSEEPGRDDYFVDGMTEALIARLGRNDELRVISRTSAMQLKNTEMTIPEIADALDVDVVIEGSVLTSDNNVRITLQLIDGAKDQHLWTNSYIRPMDNIFALQDDVANAIATELHARFGTADPTANTTPESRPATTSTAAYRAYLKGRYHFNNFGEDNFRAALDYYEEAIDLDPDFALAWASLAEGCNQPIVIFNRIRSLDDCKRYAERAVALDDNLAEAHAALGFTQIFHWEWGASDKILRRAIELDPNSVLALQSLMIALRTNYRFEEALAKIRRAEEIDPLNLFVKCMVGWVLYDMRRYDEALAQWDDVIDMKPDFMLAHYNRGIAFIEKRDAGEVFAIADRITELAGAQAFEARLLEASAHAISGDSEQALEMIAGMERDSGTHMAAWIASIHLMMGDEEAAFARLERGLTDKSADLPSIAEPKFDAVRTHPRFVAISEAIGVSPIG